MNDGNALWAPEIVKNAEYPDYTYDDAVESQDIEVAKILNYPVDQELLDFAAFETPVEASSSDAVAASPALKSLLGLWNGHLYWSSVVMNPWVGMLSMDLHAVEGQDGKLAATCRSGNADYTISGECAISDSPDIINFTFKRIFTARYSPQYFKGTWNAATDTLTGTWGFDSDLSSSFSPFHFKRMAPQYLCWYPSPADITANKAQALWSFAISSVRDDIRRQSWTWEYFRQRRDHRKTFIELYVRQTRFGRPIDDTEAEELRRLKKTFTSAENRFYHSLGDQQIRVTSVHE